MQLTESLTPHNEMGHGMNTKPTIPANYDLNSRHRFVLTIAIAVLIGCGTMLSSGCADSNAEKTPVQPAAKDPPAATSNVAAAIYVPLATAANDDPQDVEHETTDKPASGVLGTASKIIEKAKSKGGSTASGASKWVQDKISGATEAGNQTADDTLQWANQTYDSLKSQGLTTAKSTSEWLGQDWSNMESWEYKVITLAGTDDELAEQLNAFGKQGWECFNTQPKGEITRFYLKKPTFSYLRQLPFKDVIKLIPMMNSGEK